jgi:hypothetical protein
MDDIAGRVWYTRGHYGSESNVPGVIGWRAGKIYLGH